MGGKGVPCAAEGLLLRLEGLIEGVKAGTGPCEVGELRQIPRTMQGFVDNKIHPRAAELTEFGVKPLSGLFSRRCGGCLCPQEGSQQHAGHEGCATYAHRRRPFGCVPHRGLRCMEELRLARIQIAEIPEAIRLLHPLGHELMLGTAIEREGTGETGRCLHHPDGEPLEPPGPW